MPGKNHQLFIIPLPKISSTATSFNKRTKIYFKTQKRKSYKSEIDPDDPPYITDREDMESDIDEDKDNEIIRDLFIDITARVPNKLSQIMK